LRSAHHSHRRRAPRARPREGAPDASRRIPHRRRRRRRHVISLARKRSTPMGPEDNGNTIETDVPHGAAVENNDVLDVRGLRKTYESEGVPVRALRGVDFVMEPGEFVAVMGPSGCGKSTLLNLVAGLDTPTDGEIAVAGESLVGKDENDLARMRRRHIGIVF